MKNLRNATTVGVLIGAMSVRQRIEVSTNKKLQSLKDNVGRRTVSQNKAAIRKFENSLIRDLRSLEMLRKIVDAGMNRTNEKYQEETSHLNDLTLSSSELAFVNDDTDVQNYLDELEVRVKKHLGNLHKMTENMKTSVINWYNPPKPATTTTAVPIKIQQETTTIKTTTTTSTTTTTKKPSILSSTDSSLAFFPAAHHSQIMAGGIAIPTFFYNMQNSMPPHDGVSYVLPLHVSVFSFFFYLIKNFVV